LESELVNSTLSLLLEELSLEAKQQFLEYAERAFRTVRSSDAQGQEDGEL
jgi:hypothetical protein